MAGQALLGRWNGGERFSIDGDGSGYVWLVGESFRVEWQ